MLKKVPASFFTFSFAAGTSQKASTNEPKLAAEVGVERIGLGSAQVRIIRFFLFL